MYETLNDKTYNYDYGIERRAVLGNYFEINVALNGKHFFATAPRSITTFGEMVKVYYIFKEKFPKSEGYEISVTNYITTGKFMNLDALDELTDFCTR